MKKLCAGLILCLFCTFEAYGCGSIGQSISISGQKTIETYAQAAEMNKVSVEKSILAIDGVLGLVDGFFIVDKELVIPGGIKMILNRLEEISKDKRNESGEIIVDKFTTREKNEVVSLFSRLELEATKYMWSKRNSLLSIIRGAIL